MANIKLVGVYNFEHELFLIRSHLSTHRTLSMDTEFPRLRKNTPWSATELDRYKDVTENISSSMLLQVGITISDDDGHIAGTWQFNLFDSERMKELGRDYGITFTGIPSDSIPLFVFVVEFVELLADCRSRGVQWVTFHGLYDIGHLVSLVTGEPLPSSVSRFMELVGRYFGIVYDIRFMLQNLMSKKPEVGIFYGKSPSLEKLATMLGVKRVGRAHQGGSDSLVTAEVHARFLRQYKQMDGLKMSDVEGILSGLESYPVISNERRFECSMSPYQLFSYGVPRPQVCGYMQVTPFPSFVQWYQPVSLVAP